MPGKHVALEDQAGDRNREFPRRYLQEDDVDPNSVASSLSGKVLTISAEKKEGRAVAIQEA